MEVITIESKAYQEMMSKIDKIEKSTLHVQQNSPVKYEKEWLTGKEVCNMLKICYRTLYRMKLNGNIRYTVFYKRSMFHIDDVERFIRDNRKYSSNR